MAYRTSALKAADLTAPRPVVLAAKFALRPADPLSLRQVVARYSHHRQYISRLARVPGRYPRTSRKGCRSGGVDQAGLKGTQIGAARVSDLHGNFMLNLGGASATEMLSLVALIQGRVFEQFGVELELEIQVTGEDLP
ncbi:MAG: hypothetical protein U0556_16385 [Dehalococcoidia bacterium]